MKMKGLMSAGEKHKALIAIVMIQVIYAGQSLFSKASISQGMKPSVFVAYRQALATLVLAPFAFFLERTTHSLSFRVLFKMFLIGVFGVGLCLNLSYNAMNYVSATFVTATGNTIPVMVFIMAVCLRIERLNISQWSGIAKVTGTIIGISGAMVFTFYKGPHIYHHHQNQNPHHSSTRVYSKEEWIKGSILMLGSNFAWSMWLILQGPILKEYPAKLRFTALQCCFSSMISAVYGAAFERKASSWKLGWDFNLFSVAYCGIVVTGLSYWLQVWVVNKEGPVFIAVFSPLALLITAVFSAIFLKEVLHWGSVLAAVLLVAGLYSFLWGKNTEAKSQKIGEHSDQLKEEAALEHVITCPTSINNNEGERK